MSRQRLINDTTVPSIHPTSIPSPSPIRGWTRLPAFAGEANIASLITEDAWRRDVLAPSRNLRSEHDTERTVKEFGQAASRLRVTKVGPDESPPIGWKAW